MSKNNFGMFLEKIENLRKGSIIKVDGVKREAIFMASYSSEHFPNNWYIKLFFKDGTILEVMPVSEEVFFCKEGRKEIDRSLLDNSGKRLTINGEEYDILNSNDIQVVKKIYFGDVSEGEAGCIFSDFGSTNKVWSLAKLDDGTISDVCAEKITIEDVII